MFSRPREQEREAPTSWRERVMPNAVDFLVDRPEEMRRVWARPSSPEASLRDPALCVKF